ncbi:MAG: hypothetical protein QOD28_960 [Acidobacteriota bacterium]|nr:hypothetical protein [Acidobacteriota bacterium]
MPRHNLTPDYQKLSELYGTFLGALGGVSITVLSIVMAFNTDRIKAVFFQYLIAALGAAAFSCFTGGHLMTETAAFICKSREEGQERQTGVRLCAIATINIYNSVVLIIFSLVVVVVGLNPEYVVLKVFFIVLFACIIMSALIWVVLTITDRLGQPEDAAGWKPPFIASSLSLACIYLLFATPPPVTIWASLFISLICTFLPLAYFNRTYKDGDQLRYRDVYFFATCTILPCVSIVISCFNLRHL